MSNSMINKEKSATMTLTDVQNPQTNVSELRKTLIACQVMFQARAYVASPLVDRLRPEDVTMTYQAVILTYTKNKFNLEKGKSRFHRADLARFGNVYTTLLNFVTTRRTQESESRFSRTEVPFNAVKSEGHCFVGEIPRRRMRLGEYLYFCGAISREQLKQAFDWQRNSRPLFGQVAVSKGYLTVQDFARVLSRVGRSAYFGQTACDMHLMTPAQVKDVLDTQSGYNMPLGRFFVEKKIISAEGLKGYLAGLKAHNESYKDSVELRLVAA